MQANSSECRCGNPAQCRCAAMKPKQPDLRVGALQRFAGAITILNILGRLFFGFEESWAQMLVAMGTAYAVEFLLEWLDAREQGRPLAFLGGVGKLITFLLPAHISAMAISMLLYPGDRLMPMAFAATVAIASKWLLRVPTERGMRHVMNPSNTGIAVTLLLFPSVGIAPPYHFTENLGTAGDWLLPSVILISGTFLNSKFTNRIPLIVGWLGGFALQAIFRSTLEGTPLVASLLPMTGMAFALFTFYMVPDPGTTPSEPKAQFVFGASVAAIYGILIYFHVVFTLFFALCATCLIRGVLMYIGYLQHKQLQEQRTAEPPTTLSAPMTAREVVPISLGTEVR